MLNISTWNSAGWTSENENLRQAILKTTDSEIILVQETHLANNTDNQPSLDGYKWYGHCRTVRHVNSNLTHGGIGIFVKDSLFEHFIVSVLDNSYDGILCLLFKDKVSNFCFTVYCVYLPPENSPYGRDSTTFFTHLLSLIYLHNFVDCSFVCGDINGRIGGRCETITDVDFIPSRIELDTTHNQHGDAWIDFLNEACMAVTNGRVLGSDNFTSISSKGKAVVDYIAVSIENFQDCLSFDVKTMSEIVDKYNLHVLLSSKCKLSDHSLVTLTFAMNRCYESECLGNGEDGTQPNLSKRYNYGTISDDFLTSDSWIGVLNSLLAKIQHIEDNQSCIDALYNDMLIEIFKQMDEYIDYRIASKKGRKHYKIHKPFWNTDLSCAWKTMVDAENVYLQSKAKRSIRRELHNIFIIKRKLFDRLLRRTERIFNKQKALEIENINTSNPSEFWSYIKSLGPKRKSSIPMQVYTTNGEKTSETEHVLGKWRSEFNDLYNMPDDVQAMFDADFYADISSRLPNIKLNELNNTADDLHYNRPFDLSELEKICSRMKNNKSVGPDMIPNEVLKHEGLRHLLLDFMNMCFTRNLIPSIWRDSIISPIPKSSTKDPCVPLNYRGISLLSCLYKMYTSLLNSRLTDYIESNDLLVDEQNGFRSKRSCQDHIYSLSSVIRNRKSCKLDTYCAFVDFKKAFDWVPRDLLLFKLATSFNVHGKLFNTLSTIYETSTAKIRLNGLYTESFGVTSGVKQGDIISPTLFSMYLNDLATGIKDLDCGVEIDEFKLAILLYADDIVLIAPNEESLQSMLTYVSDWCKKWRMAVNIDKTNVVHFRSQDSNITQFDFFLGNDVVKIVSHYKYLGVIFDEFLLFDVCSSTLADSAVRALGSIRTKLKSLKECGYNSFNTLFNSGVLSIADYGAGIWGTKTFDKSEQVSYRAARYFLGVHRFAPTEALLGDMGWVTAKTRHKLLALKYWNRLCKLYNNRITRRVFDWDRSHSNKRGTWSYFVKHIMIDIGIDFVFECAAECDIVFAEFSLAESDVDTWNENRYKSDKLRYYNLYKCDKEQEDYLNLNISKYQRSLLAQFRCGILPLEIEVGRYRNEELSNRICRLCSSAIEDEIHFLCECPKYNDLRNNLYTNASKYNPLFIHKDNFEKFVYLMSNCHKAVSLYLSRAIPRRRNSLYVNFI